MLCEDCAEEETAKAIKQRWDKAKRRRLQERRTNIARLQSYTRVFLKAYSHSLIGERSSRKVYHRAQIITVTLLGAGGMNRGSFGSIRLGLADGVHSYVSQLREGHWLRSLNVTLR